MDQNEYNRAMQPAQPTNEPLVELAQRLVLRLERLSVDSHWAVHASGVRRSLLRALDDLAAGDPTARDSLTLRTTAVPTCHRRQFEQW